MGVEESLEAVRNYSLRSAAIITEAIKTFETERSKLESELNSLRIDCNEKQKEVLKLEGDAYDSYEDGFENALQQIRVLYPDIDLSGADSMMRVLRGRIVDPLDKAPFGVVTSAGSRTQTEH